MNFDVVIVGSRLAGLTVALNLAEKRSLAAGAHLEEAPATRFIVEGGRTAIEWLIEQGVPFTRDDAAELGFHLTREGGHSHRRIIHAADAAGHAVVAPLSERVRRHPNIPLLEDHNALD